MNLVQTFVIFVVRKMTDNIANWILRSEASNGSLKQSCLVVVIVTIQLLLSVSAARAIILFLLLTSGDVEQNPGPGEGN